MRFCLVLPHSGHVVQSVPKENYLNILLKGWISLNPIALLFLLSVYVFTERFVVIRRSFKVWRGWIEKVLD